MYTLLGIAAVLLASTISSAQQGMNNQTVSGYKGIWFTLNQFSEWGDKYSGGLGTYTAHHSPMAIYAPEVNKTFFVYGGTRDAKEKHLLCMIGAYDHTAGTVSLPVIVHDKVGVNDPHDNPSLLIAPDGHLWVFVSGRNTRRMGFKYKSEKPYDISSFKRITEEVMTYPQPAYIKGKGFFHFFTKYTGVRELYFETSKDGIEWTPDVKIAGIRKPDYEKSGHYQVSISDSSRIITFFNWHPNGDVDKRTNIYFIQTRDFGKSFETIDGRKLELPLEDINSPSLAIDYRKAQKNVYLCDAVFDRRGEPVCLYVTSKGHQPGPQNGPREWRILFRRDNQWHDKLISTSDHNYDMGSIFVDGNSWRVIAPTDPGPQPHGSGGEVVIWESNDEGIKWKRLKQLTSDSKRNHNYVRRVVDGREPFLYFWADGNPDKFSESHLYFGDRSGRIFELPYEMKSPGKPVQANVQR